MFNKIFSENIARSNKLMESSV